jgi:hypothetical protein
MGMARQRQERIPTHLIRVECYVPVWIQWYVGVHKASVSQNDWMTVGFLILDFSYESKAWKDRDREISVYLHESIEDDRNLLQSRLPRPLLRLE